VTLNLSSSFVDEEIAHKTCPGQPVTEFAVTTELFNPLRFDFAIILHPGKLLIS